MPIRLTLCFEPTSRHSIVPLAVFNGQWSFGNPLLANGQELGCLRRRLRHFVTNISELWLAEVPFDH